MLSIEGLPQTDYASRVVYRKKDRFGEDQFILSTGRMKVFDVVDDFDSLSMSIRFGGPRVLYNKELISNTVPGRLDFYKPSYETLSWDDESFTFKISDDYNIASFRYSFQDPTRRLTFEIRDGNRDDDDIQYSFEHIIDLIKQDYPEYQSAIERNTNALVVFEKYDGIDSISSIFDYNDLFFSCDSYDEFSVWRN